MKLYYDMLLPYMPDCVLNEEGKQVPDKRKESGRKAMEELVKFQVTNNPLCLYQAVLNICIYADVDLVDTILHTHDIDGVDEDMDPIALIDQAAYSLFKSIKPSYEFYATDCISHLLMAAHWYVDPTRCRTEEKSEEVSENTDD